MKKKYIYIGIVIIVIVLFMIVFFSVKSTKVEKNQNTSMPSETLFDQPKSIYSETSDMNTKMTNWNYDSDNNVYYKLGLIYCTKPVDKTYESLAIYVPGEYFDGTENENGTYKVSINSEKTIGKYTADSAPYVMPIKGEKFEAQKSPTKYNYKDVEKYIKAGFIYVHSGSIGSYAPLGVTDYKAAIRYLKYNSEALPGNEDEIFVFGNSAGATECAILASSGDSDLYTPYLNKIGAIMNDDKGQTISDAISGANCWCPTTSFEYANEAYEWDMGQYNTSGTRAESSWTKELSNDMAKIYANYINKLALKDENGSDLKLISTTEEIYASGTYYDYIKSVIENSLNNFLKNTVFPYTDNYTKTKFKTLKDYINYLNSTDDWVTYDVTEKKTTIISVGAFVKHCKIPSEGVPAFDTFSKNSNINYLFGNKDNKTLHFDYNILDLLNPYSEFDFEIGRDKYTTFSDFKSSYFEEFSKDLDIVDEFENSSKIRQNMYDPLYYLNSYYAGYQSSNVADHWRIRTGINQEDNSLTTEVNLALALNEYFGNTISKTGQETNIDFATVWGEEKGKVEISGNADENFIKWVTNCVEGN